MKPNTFLIGAPKCGTTSLAAWLSTHPSCFLSEKKEPHFFDDYLQRGMSLDEYEQLFRMAAHEIVIDASTSYLSDEHAVERILEYNPDAKFIALLRNPVEMAPAFHEEVFFRGAESVADFAIAWGLQESRRAGIAVPPGCENIRMIDYSRMCALGTQVARLADRVDPGQFLLIFTEDMKNDARRVYQDVLHFLNIADDGRQAFPAHNVAKAHSAPWLMRLIRIVGRYKNSFGIRFSTGVGRSIHRMGRKDRPRPVLEPNLRKNLELHFASEIRLLSSLTGRDLSHWTPNLTLSSHA